MSRSSLSSSKKSSKLSCQKIVGTVQNYYLNLGCYTSTSTNYFSTSSTSKGVYDKISFIGVGKMAQG